MQIVGIDNGNTLTFFNLAGKDFANPYSADIIGILKTCLLYTSDAADE